jgi:hypothetical protein
MIKITDLREGDIVHIIDQGTERLGNVSSISREDNMARINNGIQEFWFGPEEIVPIPLTEKQLVETLGFEKEETSEGVKFKKGPFRILVHDPGNYTNMEVWYREDRRHFSHPLYVHELQNHHMDMTKMPLEAAVIH